MIVRFPSGADFDPRPRRSCGPGVSCIPRLVRGLGEASRKGEAGQAYSYARARAALLLTHGSATSGPYIVSSLAPLQAGQALKAEYLWQDLSVVPPSLTRLWVREYLAKAVNRQGYADRAARASWTIRLRTVVAVAAEGVPDVKNALDTLIKWFNDGGAGSYQAEVP